MLSQLTMTSESVQYIIGLDPGGTTGYARISYSDNEPFELLELQQINGGLPGFHHAFKWSGSTDHFTIVSEKWVEFNKAGVDRTPMYIEGYMYSLWQDKIKYQEPKIKQVVITDDYLKENGLWVPGKRHQMDALIHALHYLATKIQHKPTLETLGGISVDAYQAEEDEWMNDIPTFKKLSGG